LAAVEELSEEELKELQEGYRLKAQSPDGAQKKKERHQECKNSTGTLNSGPLSLYQAH
jgi:hypothetical protein